MSLKVHCANNALVDPARLRPNPVNPNRHSAHQIQLLAAIIQEQGWRAPITVSKRSGLIVRGHGRLEAALLMGAEVVHCAPSLMSASILATWRTAVPLQAINLCLHHARHSSVSLRNWTGYGLPARFITTPSKKSQWNSRFECVYRADLPFNFPAEDGGIVAPSNVRNWHQITSRLSQ